MRPAHVIEIVTPKKILLNGLWLGPRKPKRVVVWVHGLGSTMFSKLFIADKLIDKETAVLAFNNRGHDKVANIQTVSGKRIQGGAAHEVFTDCVDDIQGAVNFAKKSGVKNIFLTGHSTGCQKSAYWASKVGRGVNGVVLLAPMSDYASERMAQGVAALRRAEKVARAYVRQGKKNTILPENVWAWPWIADAQRFMTLYTGEGPEEIFTYWDPRRNPKALHSVKLPVLVLLAEKDEYADRPAKKIGDWFAEHLKIGDEIVVVPKVGHSFKGAEKKVAGLIRGFMKS
ncbi:MAG: alpha/beta fold hydrolase [Patescibacteria group bacterium]